MNADAELLNFIYQNSQMGMDTMKQIIEIAENEAFQSHLKSQEKEYKAIHEEAKKRLNEKGYDEKEIGAMNKITAYVMINMKTLTNKSTKHIAEMLVNGSNMGIVDATKNIHKYEKDADKDILALMKKLLKTEESNMEKLKEYL